MAVVNTARRHPDYPLAVNGEFVSRVQSVEFSDQNKTEPTSEYGSSKYLGFVQEVAERSGSISWFPINNQLELLMRGLSSSTSGSPVSLDHYTALAAGVPITTLNYGQTGCVVTGIEYSTSTPNGEFRGVLRYRGSGVNEGGAIVATSPAGVGAFKARDVSVYLASHYAASRVAGISIRADLVSAPLYEFGSEAVLSTVFDNPRVMVDIDFYESDITSSGSIYTLDTPNEIVVRVGQPGYAASKIITCPNMVSTGKVRRGQVRGWATRRYSYLSQGELTILPDDFVLPLDGSTTSTDGRTATETGSIIYATGYTAQAVQIAEATTNLCNTPDLETSIARWTTTSIGSGYTWGRVNTPGTAWHGSYYARLVLGTGSVTNGGMGPYYNVNPIPGGTYTATMRVKAPTGNAAVGKSVRLTLVESGGAGGAKTTTGATFTLTDEWQTKTITRTLTQADDTYLNCYCRFVGVGAAGDEMWGDGGQIELKAYPTPFCTGSLGAGHTWSGTAGNSASVRAAAVLRYLNPLTAIGGSISLRFSPAADNTGPTRYLFSDGASFEAYFNAADDKLYFRVGPHTISSAALTFSADTWMQLAFTWNLSGMALYRNGVLLASSTYFTLPTLGTYFYLGSDPDGANQCNGLLDDVSVLSGTWPMSGLVEQTNEAIMWGYLRFDESEWGYLLDE